MSALRGACRKNFGLAVLMVEKSNSKTARASKTVGIRQDLMDVDGGWVKEDVNVFSPLLSVFKHQRRWRNQTQDMLRMT
jgi:hypothetical protein